VFLTGVARRPILVALAFAAGPAQAFSVESLEARYAEDSYRVVLEAVLDAPADRVQTVLTDFAAYAALDPRIRRSEVVARPAPGTVLLRTRVHACAGWFCRDVDRVEQVSVAGDSLTAVVVPEGSDFRRGETRTQWTPAGRRTRVRYEAQFALDFWVPALVARRLAVQSLRQSTLELFGNVEDLARER
jgi:hypothetical protein